MIDLSEAYFGVTGYVPFWALFVVSFGLFARRSYFLVKVVMLGGQENRFDNMASRIFGALGVTLLQWCNLKNVTRKDRAGIGHAVLFWGFCLFFIYYVVFIGLGSGLGFSKLLSDTVFEHIYATVIDVAAVLIIVSLIWAAVRRYVIKPERLAGVGHSEAAIILILIFCLMALHLLGEGFYSAAHPGAAAPPSVGAALGAAIGNLDISQGAALSAHKTAWWLHYILLLGFLVFIPYSKHLHILASPVNMAFKKTGAKGALKDVDITNPANYRRSAVTDFTWKQLLDGLACTVCGRCYDACPARKSGKPLSPRELMLGIKDRLLDAGPGLIKGKKANPDGEQQASSPGDSLVGDLISEDAVWACTTCGACQEVCPATNEQMNAVVDLRRHLQMGALTTTAQETLKNLRVRMHPWRGTLYARTDWAEEMDIKIVGEDDDIDVLFWVGCTGALEDRCQKVTKSVANLLKLSGINFGILGEEEMCCGDPARRLGGEHLYQMLAAANIQLLNDYNIKKIVTACPHCYNTLLNEYPKLGGDFEVIHHTELFAEQIQKNKLSLSTENDLLVTYHDPCYLGRHNESYQPARAIIGSIPGLNMVEMENNRKDSMCCGGGGGRLWLEENIGRRISNMRFEQATDTKAGMIVTACPYCLQMFSSEIDGAEGNAAIEVKDVAELVVDTIRKKDKLLQNNQG